MEKRSQRRQRTAVILSGMVLLLGTNLPAQSNSFPFVSGTVDQDSLRRAIAVESRIGASWIMRSAAPLNHAENRTVSTRLFQGTWHTCEHGYQCGCYTINSERGWSMVATPVAEVLQLLRHIIESEVAFKWQDYLKWTPEVADPKIDRNITDTATLSWHCCYVCYSY